MTGILLVQIIAHLLVLGLIFLDRKNNKKYKWRRFWISIPTLLVMQVIWYFVTLSVGPKVNFGNAGSAGDLGYFIAVVYLLSISTTIPFSRWYANNY